MISEQLEIIIQKAFELAKKKNHEFLTLEHLLLELCSDQEVKNFFNYKGINIKFIIEDLTAYILGFFILGFSLVITPKSSSKISFLSFLVIIINIAIKFKLYNNLFKFLVLN